MKQKLLLCFLLFCLFSVAAFAQRTVSGKVTDPGTGEGIPGVSVFVKGTTSGTVTDAGGNYSISVAEDATLVFQAVGLTTQEVAVGSQASIDMSLAPDTRQLGEVVITAIGLESEKRALGYSIQTVKSEDLVSARETNLVNALNSKVAGVNVISSTGSPGASALIRIRGNRSINGNNSPLFVVDGIPVDNSEFNNGVGGVDQSNRAIDLNPNDIASLTVLKGPAATSLYGVRAANGAIIITTKKGKLNSKASVVVSSAFTVDRANKLPDLQTYYAQGQPLAGGFSPTWRGPHTQEGFSWGPAFSDLEFADDVANVDGLGPGYAFDNNGILVPRGTGNGNFASAYDPYDFFVSGLTFDNNVSVSGGSANTTYFFSGGYLNQTGIVPNADFKRTTLKATIESKISDKITVGATANFVRSGGTRIQRGSNVSGVMLGLLRNTPSFDIGNGLKGRDAADEVTTYLLPNGRQRSYRYGVYDSPYWTVNKNPSDDNVNRIIGNVNVNYKPLNWLTLSYKVGGDHYTDRRESAVDINSTTNPGGSVTQTVYTVTDFNSDALALINLKLSDNLDLDATIGHNYFEHYANAQSATGNGFGAIGFYNIANASSVVASNTYDKRKIHGVFADVKLSFKNMLFFNLSGRNDWSSTFIKSNNSFFYPAASLGFVFTEPLGLSENPIFSFGKLRVSYGRVGNDAPTFSTQTYFVRSAASGDGFIRAIDSPIAGFTGFERSTTRGNPDLKPEFTSTFEVGGEFRFLNDRLGLDVTYYNSKTTDAIINVDVPRTTGFTNQVKNTAEIENKGLEVTLNGTPVKSGDFSWDVDINFFTYKNTVVKLAEGVERVGLSGFTSTSSNAIAGQPYGIIFGNRYRRDDQGQLLIGDNGWPLVAPTDGPVGDPNPDFTLGFRNTFSWKGISLSFLLDIRQGGQVWNGTGGIMDYFGTSERSGQEREIKGHVFQGVRLSDGQANTTPVDFYPNGPYVSGAVNSIRWVRYAFGGLSEENIEDGSWIRGRELTIGYKLPPSLFQSLLIKGVDINFTARNLFLFTSYRGIDPETNLTGATNGFGLDYFNMPNTRSYGATVKLTF